MVYTRNAGDDMAKHVYHRSLGVLKLIKQTKCKNFAEIGVWRGGLIRKILPLCTDMMYWAIDPWHVLDETHAHMSLLTQNNWNRMYRRVSKLMLLHPNLRIIRATSVDAAKIFTAGYFDLVFIDGSHFYKDVLQDIKKWKQLVRSGGIISGHDYNSGDTKGHNVKQAVDEIFPNVQLLRRHSIWWQPL